MRISVFILFVSFTINCQAQQTYVPDDNFEAYLENNGMGNGIMNDNYVTTANISGVTTLWVIFQNIQDLTGIEDFTSLSYLRCNDNQLTSLNFSSNFDLEIVECYNNQLLTLDVSHNGQLKELYCSENLITSLDLSQNTDLTDLSVANNQLTSINTSQNTSLTEFYCDWNHLTSLDVSTNTMLQALGCTYNQLTSLDLSANNALTALWCSNNDLACLNVKNGNNNNFSFFNVLSNLNLTCIEVDNAAWSTANWTNIDTQISFSTNCQNACSTLGVEDLNISEKELVKVVDLMGRETTPQKNKVLIFIYSDGTTERAFEFE